MTVGNKARTVRSFGRNRYRDVSISLSTGVQTVTSDVDAPILRTATENRVWSGGDRPDYRRVISDRGNAINTYSASRVRHEVKPYTKTGTQKEFQWYGNPNPSYVLKRIITEEYRDHIYQSDPGSTSASGAADIQASQQFTRRTRQAFSEAQALVTAGELREAVQMVLGARRKVFDRLRSFQNSAKKRGRGKRTIPEKKKAVADSWLEYSFGWAPLVSDVSNLANAAAASIAGSMRSFEIKGRGRAASVNIGPTSGLNWVGGLIACSSESERRTTAETLVYYYGAIDVDIDQPGRYSSQFGLTMDNWIPSIWELVPWSFAVDYFTGLGDFLSSITAPWSSFRYIGKSTVTRVTREQTNFRIYDNYTKTPTNYRLVQATPGESRCINESIVRVKVTRVTRWPSLRVPGHWSSYVNLAALGIMKRNNHL